MSKSVYEAPSMVKIGGFDELTNATRRGYWIDFFGGWWL
ncbi:lasso RiPP family leader peptide-containing protein [Brooklawnia sp.]